MVVATLFLGCNNSVISMQLTWFQGTGNVVTTLPGCEKGCSSDSFNMPVATLAQACYKVVTCKVVS